MVDDKLKKILGNNKLFVGLGIVIILGVLGFLVFRFFSNSSSSPSITEDQILIEKGGNTVIVNKNGLIEYRSGEAVFYQNWDQERVSNFFSTMERKARDYLKNGQSEDCPTCYKVTLYVDGNLVTFYVTDDEGIIDEIFEDFDDDSGDGENISNYFNNGNTPTPSDDSNNGGSTNPTPISGGQGTGGNTDPLPTSAYNPQDNYPTVAAGCDAWGGQIAGGKAIISNTYCVVTPSPSP